MEPIKSGPMTLVTSGADQLPDMPILVTHALDANELMRRTQGYIRAHGGADFINGSFNRSLFNQDVEGRPFVILTEPIYRTRHVEASTKEQSSETGRSWQAFDKQVVNVKVRLLDIETGQFGDIALAEFGGGYVINAFKSFTLRELVGERLWTLWRNPTWAGSFGLTEWNVDRHAPPTAPAEASQDEVVARIVPQPVGFPPVASTLPAAQLDIDEDAAYRAWLEGRGGGYESPFDHDPGYVSPFTDDDNPPRRGPGRPKGSTAKR